MGDALACVAPVPGRRAWQGEILHGVSFDEEPPMDGYMEGLTRTNATDGIVMVTFTPLKGMSDVVRLFLSEGEMGDIAWTDRFCDSPSGARERTMGPLS